jgi:hypothetical protein
MPLLYDLLVDLPEGITSVTLHAATKEKALEAGRDLFPGSRITVVLKQGEPGTELD